jgi:hypothetical protein
MPRRLRANDAPNDDAAAADIQDERGGLDIGSLGEDPARPASPPDFGAELAGMPAGETGPSGGMVLLRRSRSRVKAALPR